MRRKVVVASGTSNTAGGRQAGSVRVGIGGWNYEPWWTTFYPPDLKKKDELAYASGKVTAIEINATYYRTQSAASFARWAGTVPDDFAFTVKASRYATNRKQLADAGESIGFFIKSGIGALGPKLGAILWQFMPTKRFDAEDFAAFLALLPKELDGSPLRHALDVRHDSFRCEAFVDLARTHRAAIVCSDSDDYPMIADVTSDFVYARLMRARADVETGYDAASIDRWRDVARDWSRGGSPQCAPLLARPAKEAPREAFVFFINGAKERAPAAAMATIAAMGQDG